MICPLCGEQWCECAARIDDGELIPIECEEPDPFENAFGEMNEIDLTDIGGEG